MIIDEPELTKTILGYLIRERDYFENTNQHWWLSYGEESKRDILDSIDSIKRSLDSGLSHKNLLIKLKHDQQNLPQFSAARYRTYALCISALCGSEGYDEVVRAR